MTVEPARWFTSSYSSNGGDCVEVAANLDARGTVGVRDSKDPTGPALSLPADSFSAFVSGVRKGEFGTV